MTMKPSQGVTIRPRKVESILEEVEKMRSQVMQRAYDLFTNRGAVDGLDLQDWFDAEEELSWKPAVEFAEKGDVFVVQAALPGVEPKDLNVQVTAEDLLIKADVRHLHEEKAGTIHLCEFHAGKLFRRIHFPRNIDPGKVKAEYANGLLRVVAAVAKEKQPNKLASATSGSPTSSRNKALPE